MPWVQALGVLLRSCMHVLWVLQGAQGSFQPSLLPMQRPEPSAPRPPHLASPQPQFGSPAMLPRPYGPPPASVSPPLRFPASSLALCAQHRP